MAGVESSGVCLKRSMNSEHVALYIVNASVFSSLWWINCLKRL